MGIPVRHALLARAYVVARGKLKLQRIVVADPVNSISFTRAGDIYPKKTGAAFHHVDLAGVRQAMLRGDAAPMHSAAFYQVYSVASLTLARKKDSSKAVAEPMANAAATTVAFHPAAGRRRGFDG